MIAVLRVRNLAVIDELELELSPGLNVITGETGAGKSMLVKALELVLGARATADLVRTGSDTARVEALFELPNGEEHVLTRTVTAAGRSKAYVDGELATVGRLRELARQWVDISSQHEHHTLVDPRSHLAWLDRFAGTATLLHALRDAVKLAGEAASDLRAFRLEISERAERMDLLRFQLAEIERVDPSPGELDAVLEELERLGHAEGLERAAREAAGHLHFTEPSAVALVGRAATALSAVRQHDSGLKEGLARLESVRIELEDLASELEQYRSHLDPDPARLAQLAERDQALSRLVRRHGSLEAALAHREQVRSALDALQDADAHEVELAERANERLEHAAGVARGLSAQRREHAGRLAEAVTVELAALGMGHARIEVGVDPNPGEGPLQVDGARLGPSGLDHVEFLIAPNPGEDPRPLSKVASGGELSRALLALKQVLAGLGPVHTYVFDEVDTGVGGAVAEAIGKKLHTVARHHQVLCITHQAVIAAWADHHHQVGKRVAAGRTHTHVNLLDRSERQEELARMLGGETITAGVRQAAADLLDGAHP